MPQARVMSWNMGQFDQARATIIGVQFVQFVASVIQGYGIDMVGFSGILSGLGGQLGSLLVKELNNRDQSPTKWREQASPPLGLGRNEQYSFVWNSQKFLPAKTNQTDYFQYDYPKPGNQGGYYGFPLLHTQTFFMPPFLGYFQLVGTQKYMPIAIFHAPSWGLAQSQATQLACANLAQVGAFDQGQGSLLMGTFGVPADDDVTANGSNGAVAFTTLAGTNGKYTQAMNNQKNLLVDQPIVDIGMEEALAGTGDNIFFRRDGANNGLGFVSNGLVNIFTQTLGSLNDQEDWVTAPLGNALANIEKAVVGEDNAAAEPDGSYAELADAFAVYRLAVGAYLPVGITLNY